MWENSYILSIFLLNLLTVPVGFLSGEFNRIGVCHIVLTLICKEDAKAAGNIWWVDLHMLFHNFALGLRFDTEDT